MGAASQPLPPADDAQPGSSAGPAGKDKDKALPSFWIPSLTPEAKATKLEKPVSPCPSRRPCALFAREGQVHTLPPSQTWVLKASSLLSQHPAPALPADPASLPHPSRAS